MTGGDYRWQVRSAKLAQETTAKKVGFRIGFNNRPRGLFCRKNGHLAKFRLFSLRGEGEITNQMLYQLSYASRIEHRVFNYVLSYSVLTE